MDVSRDSAPSWMWLDADRLVARRAARTSTRGRSVSVPSKRYKAISAVARYTPSAVQARFQGLGRKLVPGRRSCGSTA